MADKDILQSVYPHIGGQENISRTIPRKNILYVMLKDAGAVDLDAVRQTEGIEAAELERGRLALHLAGQEDTMANKNYKKLCTDILNVIPKENIQDVFHCVTRLRIVPKDKSRVDFDALKKIDGVMQVMDVGEQVQIVVGTDVVNIYSEFCQMTNLQEKDTVEAGEGLVQAEKKKMSIGGLFSELMDTIAFIMNPAITGMIAGGMIKGVIACIKAFSLLPSDSGMLTIWTVIGDAPFYFLPIILGYSSAKRFKIKEVYGMIIGGILMYPTIMNKTAGDSLQFLFANIPCVSYASSIFPVMLCTWLFSYVYKAFDKVIHKNLRIVFTGCLSLAIAMPFLMAYIAPFGTYISSTISGGVQWLFAHSGPIAGLVYAGTKPITVMLGVKGWGAIIQNNLATLGYDYLLPLALIANFGTGGAALGVYLKTKDHTVRSDALSSCGLCILGITEPALYGTLVPNKRALAGAMIGSGIGGVLGMVLDVKSYIYSMPSVFSLPTYIDGTMNLAWCVLTLAVTFAAALAVTLVLLSTAKSMNSNKS